MVEPQQNNKFDERTVRTTRDGLHKQLERYEAAAQRSNARPAKNLLPESPAANDPMPGPPPAYPQSNTCMSAGEGPTTTKPKRYEIAKTERRRGKDALKLTRKQGLRTMNLNRWESNEERETLDETRIANRGTNLCPFLWVSLRESHTWLSRVGEEVLCNIKTPAPLSLQPLSCSFLLVINEIGGLHT